jgi:hypothetical protein
MIQFILLAWAAALLISSIALPVAWVLASKARYESPQRLADIERRLEAAATLVESHDRAISEEKLKDLQADIRDLKLRGTLDAGTGRHF